MLNLRKAVATGALGLLTAFACAAQAPASEIPAAARERLASLVGKWACKWEYLNEKGEVTWVATGTEVGRYSEDWLVEWTTEITQQDGQKRLSKAWWFYNKKDKKIYLNSVSQEGELWILAGDPVEFAITSWPKKRADGGTTIIRFRHSEAEKGERRAVMEYSTDEGKTWAVGFRQSMVPVP